MNILNIRRARTLNNSRFLRMKRGRKNGKANKMEMPTRKKNVISTSCEMIGALTVNGSILKLIENSIHVVIYQLWLLRARLHSPQSQFSSRHVI